VSTALTRPTRLDLSTFARVAGLHPEGVRSLVALGLLQPEPDGAGKLWFSPDQLAAAARIRRLRAGFGLNYAALGLVVDLLDRVARLEAALRARDQYPGGRQWT
jgi:chaperone modulatory protein CbpM